MPPSLERILDREVLADVNLGQALIGIVVVLIVINLSTRIYRAQMLKK